MKWLLVTNFGNPGDEWARMGVEELVRSVDASASMELVERDPCSHSTTSPIYIPREYDIAVVCSMPGFWSYDWEGRHVSCVNHHSFELYSTGYLSKKPLVFAGFGCYLPYKRFPQEVSIFKRDYVVPAFRKMVSGTIAYSREPTGATLFGVPSLPCPSVFAGRHLPRARDLDLCNFMPYGAHYPWLNTKESEAMIDLAHRLAPYLLARDYKFIAHSQDEFDYAIELGWAEEDVIRFHGSPGVRNDDSIRTLLSFYSRAGKYIGNRIHGGIVARSFGANVLSIGYDSRLRSVESVGGVICTPRTFKSHLFYNWLEDKAFDPPLDKWFTTQQKFFKKALEYSR